jgi:hypothetical protein
MLPLLNTYHIKQGFFNSLRPQETMCGEPCLRLLKKPCLSLADASRVHLFCNLQSRAQTHAILMIGLYELLGNPTTYLIEPPGPLAEARCTRSDKQGFFNSLRQGSPHIVSFPVTACSPTFHKNERVAQ